jgi:serine/threonine protein kinase
MEELPGYTLQEIEAAGAVIKDPAWKDLERLIFQLNKQNGVIHRDLGKQNIFLKTHEELSEGNSISGEIYLIDFGLSKRIAGSPEPEDYTLTIGGDVVRYPSDRGMVEALKPTPGQPKLFAR